MLAVTSETRNVRLPNVPTLIESGVTGFEVTVWTGLCGPAAAPAADLDKLNADLVRVLKMVDTRKRFADLGADAASTTPEQFSAFIRSDNAKWARAARNAGLEPQ